MIDPSLINLYIATGAAYGAMTWPGFEERLDEDPSSDDGRVLGWLKVAWYLRAIYFWPLSLCLGVLWKAAQSLAGDSDLPTGSEDAPSGRSDDEPPGSEDVSLRIPADEIDPAGGASLVLRPGTERARIWSPDLLALDLLGAPDLRELDLRACGDGLHLTLRGCPKLERVHFVDCGPGAVVHVDFEDRFADWRMPAEARTSLELRGRVLDVDACGLDVGVSSPAGRERRGPLDGAWLGVTPLPATLDAELVLVLGQGEEPAEPELLPQGCRTRELVVQRTRSGTLRLDAASLLQVEVSSSPVEQLVLGARMEHARVLRCPELRRLEGSGRSLSLSRGSARGEHLAIDGRWERLHLAELELRKLDCPQVESVTVESCEQLVELQSLACTELRITGVSRLTQVARKVHLHAGEVAAENLLRCALGGSEEALSALLEQVAAERRPEGLRRAVGILARIAEGGVELEQVWTIRCALQRRSVGDSHPLGEAPAWAWSFPEDLADRGWDADLRIWLHCRQEVQAARDYEEALTGPPDALQLAALGRAVQRWGEEEPLLFDLLQVALMEGVRSGSLDPALDRWFRPLAPSARIVLRALVARRDHASCPALADAFCSWLRWRMPCEEGVEVLGLQRLMGSAAARRELMSLAAADSGVDEEVRDYALALLAAVPSSETMAWSRPVPLMLVREWEPAGA